MPLDAKALAAALKLGRAARRAPRAVPQGHRRVPGRARQRRGRDRRLHAGSGAVYRDGAERASSPSSTSASSAAGPAEKSTPKIAALIAMAALPEPEPAPAVEFESAGQLLVIGPAAAALDWAERLAGQLEVSVLITAGGGELPLERKFPVWSGKRHRPHRLARRLRGRVAPGEPDRPRGLHALQRLHRACPEDAIDFDYQIDLAKCKAHRDCVKACGAIGAIDFSRTRHRAQGRVRPRARPVARAAHQAARSCRRAISRRAPIRSSRRSPRSSSPRWWASSRSRGSSSTARRSARTAAPASRAARVHRRVLERRDPAPTATTSGSSRTCAWAAAAARPCAPRAR